MKQFQRKFSGYKEIHLSFSYIDLSTTTTKHVEKVKTPIAMRTKTKNYQKMYQTK